MFTQYQFDLSLAYTSYYPSYGDKEIKKIQGLVQLDYFTGDQNFYNQYDVYLQDYILTDNLNYKDQEMKVAKIEKSLKMRVDGDNYTQVLIRFQLDPYQLFETVAPDMSTGAFIAQAVSISLIICMVCKVFCYRLNQFLFQVDSVGSLYQYDSVEETSDQREKLLDAS